MRSLCPTMSPVTKSRAENLQTSEIPFNSVLFLQCCVFKAAFHVLVQSIKMIFPEVLLILFMYVNLAVHSYFLLLNLSEINTFHIMIC